MKPVFAKNIHTAAKASRGAGLVEYGILAGLISVLAIGSVIGLGNTTRDTFSEVSSTLASNLETSLAGGASASSNGDDTGGFDPDPNSLGYIVFTAGSDASGAAGFRSSNFGTVIEQDAANAIERLYTDSTGDPSYVRYQAGYEGNYPDHSLVCDGVEYLASDTSNLSYTSGYYFLVWDAPDYPVFVDGQEYTCEVLDNSES